MSDIWCSKDVQDWLRNCKKQQQEYCDLLGNYKWTKYKPEDYMHLKRNIGFAIFDGPTEEGSDNNELLGYGEKERNLINKIFDLIKKCKSGHKDAHNIWISFLFVCCKMGDIDIKVTVIRLPKFDYNLYANENIFIDTSLRIYKSWQDYLVNNKLPDCLMCYPRNGIYFKVDEEVLLDKGISPAASVGAKVLLGADITTAVVQGAGLVVGAAAIFCPIAWPVLVGCLAVNGATGAYAMGRSIATLRDRDVHHQSIGISDAESRNCYLNIVGSAVGIASGGAVAAAARAAQAGETIALAGQVAMKSVVGASSFISGLGVANGVANILQKKFEGEEVTALDIYYVSSAALFFTNSVISTHQAHKLINDVGKSTSGITRIFNRLSNVAMRDVGEINTYSGPMTGCSSVSSTGQMVSFFTVCSTIYKLLVKETQKFMKNIIDIDKYMAEVCQLLTKWWQKWKKEVDKVAEDIFSKIRHVIDDVKCITEDTTNISRDLAIDLLQNKRDFQIMSQSNEANTSTRNENETFQDSDSESEAYFSCKGDEDALSYQKGVIESYAESVGMMNCKNPVDFARYLDFVCKFVQNEFDKEREKYEKTLNIARKYSSALSTEDFDKNYGISTPNRNQYFLEEALKHFKNEDEFFKLKLAYYIKSEDKTHDHKGHGQHTKVELFHKIVGEAENGLLSKKQYCEIASKYIELEVTDTRITTEVDRGAAIMIINGGQYIITVECFKEDDGKVSGIIVILNGQQ